MESPGEATVGEMKAHTAGGLPWTRGSYGGGAEVPSPVRAIWLGPRTGPEMLLGGKFLSGEEFLMEAVTVLKLESKRVCQQVAVVCDCGKKELKESFVDMGWQCLELTQSDPAW